MSDHGRPLESYSSRVLAEWVRVRGWSWFPEELEAIERRMEPGSLSMPRRSDEPVRESGVGRYDPVTASILTAMRNAWEEN